MRLIIKSVLITVIDPNVNVRVEFTRNGKTLSTSMKPIEEETGIVNIKQ